MKKTVSLMLSVFSLLTLSGCGGGKSDKITIKIGFWPQSNERSDLAMYEKWKEKFEADYPQYRIVGDTYIYSKETIASKAKGHTLPTVFQTWFTEPEMLITQKYIRDCDSVLKELGWDEMMDPEMKNVLSKDGKIYGVPRDAYGLGLLINKRIMGENDLLPEINGEYSIYYEDGTPAYPQTFEEVMECSRVIAENEASTKGCLILTSNKNGGWQFTNFAWNFGAEIESYDASTSTWKADLTSDACIAALTWIQEMKNEDLLLNNLNIVYDDWYSKIGSQVAMAFVGSDVLQNAQTKGEVPMDDLAFVPMPTGDGVHHYSLYGGTPYVFPSYATDEEVEGALRFLEYCGRSPIAGEISRDAMIEGNETAKAKNQPILPTIKPWKNQDYLTMVEEIEDRYVDVRMTDFADFFDSIGENKHSEEPYYAQELYEILDGCIQQVLSKPETANVRNILTTAQNNFNENYLSKVK